MAPADTQPDGPRGADDASSIPVAAAVAAAEERTIKTRVRDILLPFYKPTRSNLMPGVLRAIAMQPAVFEVWYRARAWRYLLTHGLQSFEPQAADATPRGFLGKVASYNQSQLWTWHRGRTEKIMAVLRCIHGVPANPKVLVIGPRNEAELLLLHLYGFRLQEMRSIDIFSYSPKIELMDMHDIKYPSNTFDIVYSAWTLKYSYDLQKACDEIVRVAKPGGVVAAGFTHTKVKTDVVGSTIAGGIRELHSTFGSNIDWIYWQDSVATTRDSEEVTTIFRVRKPAG